MEISEVIRETKKFWVVTITLCVVFLVIGAYAGSNYSKRKSDQKISTIVNTIKPVRENNFNYQYIFPLLTFDFGDAYQYFKNEPLSTKVTTYINSQIKNKDIDGASFYVRNFSDNHWAGTNENDQYHPGSILKVLIMMAYFRESQLDPSVLNKQLTYDGKTAEETKDFEFSLGSNLIVNKQYSVIDLIKLMIADSDNGAQNLLIKNVNRDILNNAYNDLSIKNPDSTEGDYTISPRQYSAFLRILYNSTYLTESHSEQALSIMAKSTYTDGITAGIPSDVAVAHKYGERINGTKDNIQDIELHDCGIVYAKDHPYSLCIMTKGKDITNLQKTIQGISSLVYKELTTQ